MNNPYGAAADLLGAVRTSTLAGGMPASRGEWQPPAPADLQGLVPNLVVDALIGKGGMGAVYRAHQPHLGRTVALKILRPELAQDAAFSSRFTRESRALARLSHPHIVTLYDSGTSGGYAWMVMEYIAGANLREVLAEGHLSPAEALRLVPQICQGLQYAHDQGVVHRDLKPENILIDERGQAHLVDFGLAKLDEASGSADITQPGQVLGTLHYIAPEQLAGDTRADHRVDIYALGVVIYEMLTGSLPLGRFEPPSSHVGIDVRMDDVVLRSLERDPERRWQRVDQMSEVMDAIPAAVPPVAPVAAAAIPPSSPPQPPAAPARPLSRWSRGWAWLRACERARKGAYLAGICASLGLSTPLPAWCWRVLLITLVVIPNLGLGQMLVVAYLLLWIAVPKQARTVAIGDASKD